MVSSQPSHDERIDINVRFHPPPSCHSSHPADHNRTRLPRSPPPSSKPHHIHAHHNPLTMLTRPELPPRSELPSDHPKNPHSRVRLPERPHLSQYWHDAYPPPPLDDDTVLPKPPSKIKYMNTEWQKNNPNPKSRDAVKAYYGGGGMYPGMGVGGMYPGMGGMMGGMGMGYGGMGMGYGGMMGGYGMPRYGGAGMYGGYGGGYGGYGPGMYDPMMGTYGAPASANFVDDNVDAHR
ncbi:hypothetical protein L202_08423 [Cryptococcus amylolentus CBS 6039]|uniref:Uncharacterized protein n=2 Tax=Cryptococcus amylolentus TaxID=104669 RepID=A0A1E3H9L4_9TREE|nr:hypothetical protein L202_08423 [Cryptococcus amylolentus CBS 6039]ODN73028.1 hypothetical protein L202_08423 [Cryptococcus amylolentus CBS 6039]